MRSEEQGGDQEGDELIIAAFTFPPNVMSSSQSKGVFQVFGYMVISCKNESLNDMTEARQAVPASSSSKCGTNPCGTFLPTFD